MQWFSRIVGPLRIGSVCCRSLTTLDRAAASGRNPQLPTSLATTINNHTRRNMEEQRSTKSSPQPSGTTSGVSKAPSTTHAMPIKDALIKINQQMPNLYAKLRIQNFPYTVVTRDLIVTHRLRDVNVGDVLELGEVREVGSPDFKLVRTPKLPDGAVKVRAIVMEHTHGAKTRAAMRKQRKGRRPLRTIKPRITILRVTDIKVDPEFLQSGH